MARSIVSLGMLPALASAMALRRRALASGSPPPVRAATVISLISLVKSLPRLASSAPFLCLMVCHLECRSEVHTSELQSRVDLVCRLLLECSCALCVLHSFPTRRSSDLVVGHVAGLGVGDGFA